MIDLKTLFLIITYIDINIVLINALYFIIKDNK